MFNMMDFSSIVVFLSSTQARVLSLHVFFFAFIRKNLQIIAIYIYQWVIQNFPLIETELVAVRKRLLTACLVTHNTGQMLLMRQPTFIKSFVYQLRFTGHKCEFV